MKTVRVKASTAVPASIVAGISNAATHAAADAPHSGHASASSVQEILPYVDKIKKNRLLDLLEWCYPRHMSILDPHRHAGMAPIVNGALTVSQITVSEFPGAAIQLDITAAGTTSAHVLFPSPDESALAAFPVKAGGEIHVRINVSDWSKITSLECNFCQNGGTVNYRSVAFVMSGKTQCGATDPTYSSVWNGQWRTLVFDSAETTSGGSPANWGDSARYFDVTGLRFIAVVSSAVNIQISRIYSAEWPVGVVVPIFDAWYQSAMFYARRDLLPRRWGAGGSVLSIGGAAINPTANDVAQLLTERFDVFAHGHGISGGVVTGLSGSATAVQVRKWFSEHLSAIGSLGAAGPRCGWRWHQFFQNLGQYAGSDMAGILRSLGINASRGNCSDAEFGVNPATTAYMSLGSVQRETWARRRGRFNTRAIAAYTNMNNTDGYDGAGINPAFPTLRTRIGYSALTHTPTVVYFHEIIDAPTINDNTPEFWDGFIADLDTKVAAGDIVVLSPTELEMLTYWRPGEMYVRWDGEWVYRHDPTKIAF